MVAIVITRVNIMFEIKDLNAVTHAIAMYDELMRNGAEDPQIEDTHRDLQLLAQKIKQSMKTEQQPYLSAAIQRLHS